MTSIDRLRRLDTLDVNSSSSSADVKSVGGSVSATEDELDILTSAVVSAGAKGK
jgi:hypothetical protein